MQCLENVHSARINRAACDRHTTLQEKFQNLILDKRCVSTATSELICYLQNDRRSRNRDDSHVNDINTGMKQDRQCAYNVTMTHVSKTTVVKEKAMSVTYSEWV